MQTKHEYRQVQWDDQLIDDLRQLIRLAVREDLDRYQDWTTTTLVPADATGEADVVAKEAGLACGLNAVKIVIDELQCSIKWQERCADGDPLDAGKCLGSIRGPAREILTCERLLLNLIGRLSGVASETAKYVKAVASSQCRIFDTRKTTPGWRRLEKYAVRCGGGWNHRTGLFDGVLIKDNHRMLASQQSEAVSAGQLVNQARKGLAEATASGLLDRALIVEIEVDTLEELRSVCPQHPDIVLLDNMAGPLLREAVQVRNELSPATELEASGGITLATVSEAAASGVDRISIGAITHSAHCLDVGLDWRLRG